MGFIMKSGRKRIRVMKYRRKVFKTYEPVKRIEMNKEGDIPIFLRIGGWFLFLGGMISFLVSGFFIGVKGFFGFRRKSREVFRGKTLEIGVRDGKK